MQVFAESSSTSEIVMYMDLQRRSVVFVDKMLVGRRSKSCSGERCVVHVDGSGASSSTR